MRTCAARTATDIDLGLPRFQRGLQTAVSHPITEILCYQSTSCACWLPESGQSCACIQDQDMHRVSFYTAHKSPFCFSCNRYVSNGLYRPAQRSFVEFAQSCFWVSNSFILVQADSWVLATFICFAATLTLSSKSNRSFCLASSRTHGACERQFLQPLTSMHRPLEAVDRYRSRYPDFSFTHRLENLLSVL